MSLITMPIDYEKIRQDNIEEYGKGTRHLAFFERLYRDGTHFVFELLQNAEDAKARRIQFTLFDDRLEVRHDGRPFNEKDVRGVCGVGESTKEEDFTQIGRFGIGFKSVYAFTTTPVIHCGDEHFKIQNYVRPYAVDPVEAGNSWTTLIVIPFNKDDIEEEFAKSEIGNRLRGLSARTLLFLASIEEIEYRILQGASGSYLKSMQDCKVSSLVTVIGESSVSDEAESEEWLVFEKAVEDSGGNVVVGPSGESIPPVQIAFRLIDEKSKKGKKRDDAKPRKASKQPWNGKEIEALGKAPLVVFFPTDMETELGFLIQGPYRTTPARDNIPTNDEWNTSLVDTTAELLSETVLPSLKDMKLLSVGCFKALPINTEDFPEDEFFFPIADRVRTALSTQPLLPTSDGSFVAGDNAILGRGEDIRALLGNEQLKLLFDLDHDVEWLSGEITADNAPALRDYLRYELDVTEVTPDSLAPKISEQFMEQQTDKWVIQFYGCLLGWEALWKPRPSYSSRANLRDRPILRLEDGAHVCPFDDDGHPNAYLPLKGATQVSTVKRDVAKDQSAREFLKRLGISEPDVVVEVIEEILPLYLSVDALPSATDHAEHIKTIVSAWSTDSIAKKERLGEKLRDMPFVRYHCRATGANGYVEPGDVYFPDDDLLDYFAGSEDAKFIVTTYAKDVREMLAELGVEDVPRCFEVDYGDPPHPRYSTRCPRISNYELDGLDEYLQRITDEEDEDTRREMALRLWHYLLAYAESDDDCFTATRFYFYYSPSRQTYDALFVNALREAAWLPTAEGGLARPPEFTIDQLPESFTPNQELISALNIQPDPSQGDEEERQKKEDLASQLGICLEDAEFILTNREEFDYFRQLMKDRADRQREIDDSESRNRERRRKKLKERREKAPVKESEKRLRSVPTHSRSEIDRQALFDFYYDEEQESSFCQMCLDAMPFVKRNGEECGECVDLLTENWADSQGYELRVMTPLNLVLCPVCSEIYRDYVHKDLDKQSELFEHLTNGAESDFVVCGSDIRRDKKGCVLHIDETHLGDIRDCLEGDADHEADDDE